MDQYTGAKSVTGCNKDRWMIKGAVRWFGGVLFELVLDKITTCLRYNSLAHCHRQGQREAKN